MKLFEGIKNLEIEFGNKPKSLLPQKSCNFLYDKFNASQLINWADIIISHSSSILIEAVLKSKNIFSGFSDLFRKNTMLKKFIFQKCKVFTCFKIPTK